MYRSWMIAALCLLACVVQAAPPAAIPNVASYLQEISVTVHAGSGYGSAQGSGVIITRGEVSYVWTAAHVVANLRTTRSVVDAAGTTRTVVEFKDAKIVRELTEDGRAVGRLEMDAEVLRFSSGESGEDLALLRIRKKNFVKASAVFWTSPDIPPLMTRLVHCGSLLGQVGSNSITTGVVSQIGRVHEGKVYDQTTCPAFPGSSGGGLYAEDGRYIGMVTRGAGETFNLCVPIRRMRAWAKKVGVEFALDPAVSVPSEDQLRSHPVDDAGQSFRPTTAPSR